MKKEYLLGVNQAELERLQFQHSVWGSMTRKLFDRLKVGNGWKCLDAGAGPGLVSSDLRMIVGDEGEITVLEPSEYYIEHFQNICIQRGWKNIKFVQGEAQSAKLPENYFDFIFVRWVVAFVSNPEEFIANLVRSLKPGGVIAFEEYYYEGLSLYPHGAFNKVVEFAKAYYRTVGGNPYIAALLPSMLRKNGLAVVDYLPNCLAGGPDSGVTEWAGRFFILHVPFMIEKGILTQAEADEIMNDWYEQRKNPDMIFFSPIVVDVAGAKPL